MTVLASVSATFAFYIPLIHFFLLALNQELGSNSKFSDGTEFSPLNLCITIAFGQVPGRYRVLSLHAVLCSRMFLALLKARAHWSCLSAVCRLRAPAAPRTAEKPLTVR